jgi:hypothetical protein
MTRQRMTRAQRRRQQELADQFAQAQLRTFRGLAPDTAPATSGRAPAPVGPDFNPSLVSFAEPEPSPDPSGTPRVVVGLLLCLAAFVTFVAAVSPAFGGGWAPVWLLPVAALALPGAWLIAAWRTFTDTTTFALLCAATAVCAVLFAWGAVTQVVIDGTPHLASSETAQAYRLTEALLADIARIDAADVYLSRPLSEARSYEREIEQLALEMRIVADRWNPATPRQLPNDGFRQTIRHMHVAADRAAAAAELTLANLVEPSSQRAARIVELRQEYVEQATAAAGELAVAARRSGVDIRGMLR